MSSFDSLGNPTGSNGNDGGTSRSSYNGSLLTDGVDAGGNDSMVTYDANGNPIATTGPDGLGNNLVPNSDFSSVATSGLPTDWATTTGSGISVDTTASDAAVGTTSLKMSSSSEASDQTSINIPVNANETYNLSAFLKTSSVVADSSGLGAGISAHWYNSSGTDIKDQTGFMNTTSTNDWTRKFAQLTAPTGAAYLKLECRLYGSGTVWFDGIQMEPVAYTPNLLLNSSFESNAKNSTLPDNWTESGFSTGDKLDNSNTNNGLPSLLLNGGGTTKNFSQQINAPQYPVGGFLLSGWSKQSGATANYSAYVTLNYSDGTSATTSLTFSSSTSGWQYQSAPVNVKSGVTITGITVTGDFSNESGQAWFNDLELKALPQTSSVSEYNYVQNPGFLFDYQGGALSDDWSDLQTGTGVPVWSKTEGYGDNNALEIKAGASGSATEKVANDGLAPYQSGSSYTAVGYIHTEGLGADSAYIELQALSATGTVLGTFDSNKIGSSAADLNDNVAWTHVIASVPAANVPSGTANFRVVLCQDGDPAGSAGASYFDDIRLAAADLSNHSAYDTNGNYVVSTTDAMGNTTTFTVNPNTGFVTSATDPVGNKASFTSNKNDEVLSTTLPTGDIFKYGYDANGNMTSVTDPNGNAYSYNFNELGQVQGYTETVNGTKQTTTYHHNGDGQTTEIDMPNGTSTQMGYNGANQATSVSYFTGSNKDDQWNFGFDGVGNLTSMQELSASNSTTFSYNANNELTSVNEPVSGGANTQQLTLDPSGLPTTWKYQLGSSSGTTWSIEQAFDIAGHLSQVTDGNALQYFEYDDHGNVLKATDNLTGQAEFYNYNPNQQVSKVTYGAIGLGLTYSYDADGRISKISGNMPGASASSVTYSYNTLNELTQETTWDGKTISYTYDNVGNRTSMSVTQNGTTTTTQYGYNGEKNRLNSIGSASVTYDANGNTLSDGTNTYTWSSSGRLASVKVPSGTIYSFKYDGLNRRVSAFGYNYHYNGLTSQLAYMTDSNNNLVARFIYDAKGLPAYMTLASGKVFRYVYDGQDDVIGLIDTSTGSQVVSYTYDAWGNVTVSDSSSTDPSGAGNINPFTYRGNIYDQSTKLYLMGARYYNPLTGRFLSSDTLTANNSNALSVNEFVYVLDNPVNLVDPSGTDALILDSPTEVATAGHIAIAVLLPHGQIDYVSYDNQNQDWKHGFGLWGHGFFDAAAGTKDGHTFDSVYQFRTWLMNNDGTSGVGGGRYATTPIVYISGINGYSMKTEADKLMSNPGRFIGLFWDCLNVVNVVLQAGGLNTSGFSSPAPNQEDYNLQRLATGHQMASRAYPYGYNLGQFGIWHWGGTNSGGTYVNHNL